MNYFGDEWDFAFSHKHMKIYSILDQGSVTTSMSQDEEELILLKDAMLSAIKNIEGYLKTNKENLIKKEKEKK